MPGALPIGRALAAAFLVAAISSVAVAEPPPATEVIVKLYRDFAWEAVIVEPLGADDGLLNQPAAVLRRYFDDRLSALILADRKCVRETREICNLDFSPIWASQDPAAFDLEVKQGARADRVQVSFRYPNHEKIKLDYHMTRTRRGWRISDIVYESGHTLLTMLSHE